VKCAIYARVSKKQGQETENQLVELRRYAKAQGWETIEYIDRDTGKHSKRDAFMELFEGASRRKFDVVLVWALDRLTREGVLKTFAHIEKLAGYGCRFESYTEPYFRSTGPAGELLMAVLAWVAKQERLRISERTKAGLAIARAKGRVGGRRPKVFDRDKARALRNQNPPMSWRAIARELGVAQSSIRDALAVKPRRSGPGRGGSPRTRRRISGKG